MAKEARRSPRKRHDSVLELYDEEGRLMAGVQTLVDVSSVGASFSTTKVFRKGAKIRGRLRLLDAGALEISGRVVRLKERSNSTLYGIEFDSVKSGAAEPPPGISRSARRGAEAGRRGR